MMSVEPQTVRFKNGDVDIVGVIRHPSEDAPTARRPGVVLVTPGSSVKEQIGATYGEALSKKGFTTLTFDPSHQGESDGEPRDLEDPAARVEDVRSAIDFIQSLDHVAANRIGVLGICAGGGYAVNVALTDHRIKALGTVVAVNIGRAFRDAYQAENAVHATLEAVAQQRTKEARGGELRREKWIPDSLEEAREAGIEDVDVLDAVDYYRTSRGYSSNSSNRRLFRSDALILGFDGFHLADELLTQPVQVIVGGRVGSTKSYFDGEELQRRAPNSEDLFVVEGAGHYQMYDNPDYVDQAVTRLAEFFGRHL